MPELPEVETVRRTLIELVCGKTIQAVEVKLPRIVRTPEDPQLFAALLADQTIRDIGRRGKFLTFVLDDYILVSHLRMEGRYGLYQAADPVEKHTHVIFSFTDHTELRYKDVRQFGTMDLFSHEEAFTKPPLNKLGLEPLEESFTFEAFKKVIHQRTTMIKPLLLNQAYIVGIGNIYVDESLFQAGIHPERSANSLTTNELHRLYDAIKQTLQEAVAAGGSSIKSFVNGQGEIGMFQHQFKVYGRAQQPCTNCGQPIERYVVGGRGTHICPKCQSNKSKLKK
ncbi:DNA-formamidopyrimidine glycosylase [Paenibacillus albiflavus]|uniref:Formamidopyrimidine-DNA glycosylase n=1 Tax=Paenibacillus albiflavus TaxID=2545760 RepID=A0A4R4EBI6_9BACL|nr:DNA-formamidopyrimidine glycosylase [Paenibacillus albiflavus]TCZ75288.1 DNA-formamidopyrimidine glycosylase [Paenibacillus albiflavus]